MVNEVSEAKSVGASGCLSIIAPLLGSLYPDTPTTLLAYTLTKTLSPQSRLYGAALRVEIGIEHCAAVRIAVLVPSQFTVSSVKVVSSLYLIKMEYDVSGEPPSYGVDQLTMILCMIASLWSGSVNTSAGISGILAALIVITSESRL